jgi:hypothetical protein
MISTRTRMLVVERAYSSHGLHSRGAKPLGCSFGQANWARGLLGAAAVASFLAAVLTEICLCNVCSSQEILRRNGQCGQSPPGPPPPPCTIMGLPCIQALILAVAMVLLFIAVGLFCCFCPDSSRRLRQLCWCFCCQWVPATASAAVGRCITCCKAAVRRCTTCCKDRCCKKEELVKPKQWAHIPDSATP